jgi:hypothetical protein
MNRLINALLTAIFTISLGSTLVAQQPQQQQQPAQPPPPNQVALTEAREHAKAGRTAEALAALERVTPPAPAVVNQLRTSDDFKLLRDDDRFKAIVTKLTPCSGPEYKQFDFWVGDWEVRNSAGNVLGRNRISKRYGGCVVVEEWEGAGGMSGSSFNVYDQQTKQWHQFWVDTSGTNWLSSDKQGNPVTLRGGFKDGAMVLTSHPDTLPSIGMTRTTWRPLPDGGVRQTFETSRDGGKTWTASFDGFYKKAKS